MFHAEYISSSYLGFLKEDFSSFYSTYNELAYNELSLIAN
jgi:hypothetical protein